MHQLFGVACRFGILEHRIVAGAFCFQLHPAKRQPHERMEPERRTRGACQEMDGPITSTYVLEFMHERSLNIGVWPFGCIGWQEDRGMTPPARRWSGDVFMQHDVHRPADTTARRELSGQTT